MWLGACMVAGGMRGCQGACTAAGEGHACLLGGCMHGCRGACVVAGGGVLRI